MLSSLTSLIVVWVSMYYILYEAVTELCCSFVCLFLFVVWLVTAVNAVVVVVVVWLLFIDLLFDGG